MKPAFLIDCDGTLYRGGNPLPYAPEWIGYLNRNQYSYAILTNCPSKTPEGLSEKLRRMGMEVPPERIITSGIVTAHVLRRHYGVKSAYAIGTEALCGALLQEEIALRDTNPDAVVVGYDTGFHYDKLTRAAWLIRCGARLFSTNPDNCIPSEDLLVPHTGALTAAVESACGQKAVFIGKPETPMLDYAAKLLSLPKSSFIMVGDRLDTDVAFAHNGGIASYLVLSGLGSEASGGGASIRPDRVFHHIGEIIDHLKEAFHVYESLSKPGKRNLV